ncbi:MAG: hypothetical protein ISP91_15620 [Pseudomonadales bacterium]|nr:hypothetical protein [Pseudomonadales bacterium]
MKRILFHRQYDRYSGGQQKVLDYFDHCLAHPDLEPYISWGERSVPIETTPWCIHQSRLVDELQPDKHDLMFLAGMDWRDYLDKGARDRPVLNLIQHVRHADPGSDVYPFLSREATRICVSEEVKKAIDATGLVNGSTVAIPNGIDTGYLQSYRTISKPGSVYILGLKQPVLARELETSLSGQYLVICHTDHVPRTQILNSMAACEIAVLLPHETEGFFLPALEAMSLSKIVIVPDCVGNRSFCFPGVNCLMPGLNIDDLTSAVAEAARLIQSGKSASFQESAKQTLEVHTLERERQAFYAVLDSLGIL